MNIEFKISLKVDDKLINFNLSDEPKDILYKILGELPPIQRAMVQALSEFVYVTISEINDNEVQ